MAVSCNIAFANLGIQIGRSSLLAELRRFGFDRPSASGIRFGRIVAPRGNQRQLADLSIGLEATTISPVHAALLAATFGNNGKMPEPGGFHSEDGVLGLTPVPLSSPEGQEIIEEEWLGLLLESMEAAAAPGGTASGLIPAGYRYGMKTGTAAGPGMGYFTNYIGVGPLPNPRYAFCIRVTNQQTSKRVARATRRVARRFLPTLVQGS